MPTAHVQTVRPVDVYVHRNHAYVVSIDDPLTQAPGGLAVVDIRDPSHPVITKRITLPGDSYWNAAWARDDALYIAYYQEGLRVLDVSVPPQPREIAYFNTFRESDIHRRDDLLEGAIGIRVPGDGHVYVVDTSRGLLIFNEP